MRYIINISFVNRGLLGTTNFVERVKTLKEAESLKFLIDDTVDKALIKDTVTDKVIWLKQ
jgi:hypothetical protein